MLLRPILGLSLHTGVCRQCRGEHLKTVGSTEAESDVQDPGPVSVSHPEPQIHEPSCFGCIIHAKKMLHYYDFQTRTFIHLFDECKQNWFSVASIIENVLTTMKRQESRLNEAFLRSDNAGCYHCAFLLLSLPSFGQRVCVRIARYDFSEVQAGKDTCDRRAAALKSHIRRYINEGNDVKTASE